MSSSTTDTVVLARAALARATHRFGADAAQTRDARRRYLSERTVEQAATLAATVKPLDPGTTERVLEVLAPMLESSQPARDAAEAKGHA